MFSDLLLPYNPKAFLLALLTFLAPGDLALALLHPFRRSAPVLCQSDPGDSFLAIKEGKVEVSLGNGKGDRRVLTQLGKGNILGEISLLTGGSRRKYRCPDGLRVPGLG